MIRKTSAGDASELAWFKSSYSSSSDGDCLRRGRHHPRHRPRPRLQEPAAARSSRFTPTAWADFVSYAAGR